MQLDNLKGLRAPDPRTYYFKRKLLFCRLINYIYTLIYQENAILEIPEHMFHKDKKTL